MIIIIYQEPPVYPASLLVLHVKIQFQGMYVIHASMIIITYLEPLVYPVSLLVLHVIIQLQGICVIRV